MKLSSQDLEQSNFKVFLREADDSTPPRLIAEPISVDVEAGSVSFVAIVKVRLPLNTSMNYSNNVPVEHEEKVVTKTGIVWVVNEAGIIVHATRPSATSNT